MNQQSMNFPSVIKMGTKTLPSAIVHYHIFKHLSSVFLSPSYRLFGSESFCEIFSFRDFHFIILISFSAFLAKEFSDLVGYNLQLRIFFVVSGLIQCFNCPKISDISLSLCYD